MRHEDHGEPDAEHAFAGEACGCGAPRARPTRSGRGPHSGAVLVPHAASTLFGLPAVQRERLIAPADVPAVATGAHRTGLLERLGADADASVSTVAAGRRRVRRERPRMPAIAARVERRGGAAGMVAGAVVAMSRVRGSGVVGRGRATRGAASKARFGSPASSAGRFAIGARSKCAGSGTFLNERGVPPPSEVCSVMSPIPHGARRSNRDASSL